jgi:O-antigen/teichoic acid export membrane protein
MIEIVTANVVLVVAAWLLRSPWAFLWSIGVRMALGSLQLRHLNGSAGAEIAGTEECRFRSLLRFGVPYQATTALSMIQKAMNPVLVGSLIGVSAVGLVNWSNYIVALPLLPLQPLYAFLFSVVSERRRRGEDDHKTIQVLLRAGLVVMSFVSLSFILTLPVLVSRIFGSKWDGAVPVAAVLLLGNTAAFHSSVLTTLLTAQGHSKAWMRIVVIESVLIWSIGGLGTLAFGLTGYAAGLLGAGLAVLAVLCPIVRKMTGLDARFADSLWLTIAVALSCIAGQAAVSFVGLDGVLASMMALAIALVLYSGILFLIDGGRIRKDFSELLSMLWPGKEDTLCPPGKARA